MFYELQVPRRTARYRNQSSEDGQSSEDDQSIDQSGEDDQSIDQPIEFVFFSDGSVTRLWASAATVMHFCPVGEWADAHNREEQYQCKIRITPPGRNFPRLHLTPGAMETAGIALSLHYARQYIDGVVSPLNITMYCDNKPIIEFLIDRAPSSAGASHLEGLVNYICAQIDEIRDAGHCLRMLWASRYTKGVGRAHAFARDGVSNSWPGHLLDLLLESSEVVYAADEDARNVMRRF